MHVMGFDFHLFPLSPYPNGSLMRLFAVPPWLSCSLGFGCVSGTGVAVGSGSRTTTPYRTKVEECSGLEWEWTQPW